MRQPILCFVEVQALVLSLLCLKCRPLAPSPFPLLKATHAF